MDNLTKDQVEAFVKDLKALEETHKLYLLPVLKMSPTGIIPEIKVAKRDEKPSTEGVSV